MRLNLFIMLFILPSIITGVLVYTRGALAQSSSSSASDYQFNNQGEVKPEFDKQIQFRTQQPSEPSEKPDYVGNAVDSMPITYKVPVD